MHSFTFQSMHIAQPEQGGGSFTLTTSQKLTPPPTHLSPPPSVEIATCSFPIFAPPFFSDIHLIHSKLKKCLFVVVDYQFVPRVGNLSTAMGGKELSWHRVVVPARQPICSLATQFQTRFLGIGSSPQSGTSVSDSDIFTEISVL
jgi:hypothetical protein